MTATPHERASSPSEDTPLIRRASEELQEAHVPIMFARGFVITVTMGLFLFIQGTRGSRVVGERALTESRHQCVDDDHGAIGYLRRSRRLLRHYLVQLGLFGIFLVFYTPRRFGIVPILIKEDRDVQCHSSRRPPLSNIYTPRLCVIFLDHSLDRLVRYGDRFETRCVSSGKGPIWMRGRWLVNNSNHSVP